MKFDLTPASRETGEPFASPEDLGFWGTAGDIAMSPIRGIAGAAEGVYDLLDWVMFDWLPDAEDNFGLGHSRTLVGGLAEGITQFMVGFAAPGVGGLSLASKAGKLTGLSKAATKYERAHRMAGNVGRSKAIKWGSTFAKDVTAGAVADFAVFDAQEERLSNLLQQFPALQNPVTEFLAASEDDSEIVGRMKNMMEGAALGGLMEPFLMALRGIKAGRQAKMAGNDPESAARAAQQKSRIRNIAQSLNVDESRAAGVYGLARSILGDGADDIDWVRGGEGVGSTTLRQMPDGSTAETLQLGTFFSRMDRVLKGAKQRKWQSDSLRSYLKKNGVKDEELYWSGMDDYLKANPKVDLDEAAEAVQGIQIEEVIRAEDLTDRRGRVSGSPRYESMTLPGGEDYRELLITFPSASTFRSSHFPEDNILAHIRFNTRRGANGEKVLFIEEIQSDWHQAGRKRGYRSQATQKEAKEHYGIEDEQWARMTDEDRQAYVGEMMEKSRSVPDAPFRQTSDWVSLSLKRIIAYAADKEFDAVAWTSGEIQRVRNDRAIADNVDEILVTRHGDTKSYQVTGMKSGSSVGGSHNVRESELADYIGKDMAEKAVAQFGEGAKEASFKGDDLKVGGHGYRAFYDAPDKGRGGFVWNAANKIGKKFGAKVENKSLGMEDADGKLWDDPKIGEVPTLRLTDELKTSVKTKGQPLMQAEGGAKPKGEVEFREDGETIIRGFEASDVSTGIHEIAHVARRRLLNRDVPAEARAGISDEDIAVAEKWAGAEGGKWTTAAEEKLARGFERYVRDGKAPKGLEGFFSKLAAWMREVYSEVTGSSLDVDISPEMRAVFDKLVKRGDLPPVPKARRGVSPRILHQAAEGSDDAVDAASRRADEYEARLVEEHGSVDAAPPGKRGHLTGLRNAAARAADQSGIPEGARTPREGAPMNLDRLSDYDEVGDMADAQIRSSAQQHLDDLKTENLTHDEIRAAAQEENRLNREEGLTDFSEEALMNYQGDDLLDIIVRMRVLRNYHQSFIKLVDELAGKAKSGDIADEVRFLEAQKRAQNVRVRVKRLQEQMGQALESLSIKGEDPVPTKNLLPEELLDGSDPKVFDDYLEEIGGGDLARGREIVQKDIKRYEAIRDAQGNAAALSHLADKAKWPHMLTEYWMNSILSGPITHMVNMTSNALNTLFLPLEESLGRMADGQWKEMWEPLGMYVHLWSQFTDAAKAASTAFKEGESQLDRIGKFDTDRPQRALRSSNQTLDKLGALANLPSRFLMAEDTFFKVLNYRAQVRRGLTEEGAKGGLKGEALARHIEEGMDKVIRDGQFYAYRNVRMDAERFATERVKGSKHAGTDREGEARKRLVKAYMRDNWNDDYSVLALKAREYGREVTYTRSLTTPDRAPLVQFAGKYNNLVNDHPTWRLITPFIRTPTNLITFFLNRTVGVHADIARLLGHQFKVRRLAKHNAEMAKALADSGPNAADIKGRFLTGSLFMGGAFIAFNSGNLTGGGPKDPEKRRLMEASGWQPYSIRVGDTWWSYKRLDPFANFFGVIADIGESMREADPEEGTMLESLMGSLIYSAAKNIGSKSYLTGIARVSNVLASPDRYASTYMEQTVASFLPFSSAAGQTVGADDHQVEIRGVLDAVRSKYGLTGAGTLGFDTEVAHRRNVFGEKIERPVAVGGASPLFYTQIKDDVVLQEINRLGHGFSPPRKMIMGINTQEHHNPQGQSFYDKWQENHGEVRLYGRTLKQAVRDLIRSRRYQNLPEDDLSGFESPRVAEIQKLIRRYRSRALDQTLREFPEVESLYRRNQTIKQYRRAGRDIQSLLDY